MGNKGLSIFDQKAITSDGIQNIKKNVILLQNKQHLDKFINDLKNKVSSQFGAKGQQKRQQIKSKVNQIKEIYTNKKKQVQSLKAGTIQKIQSKTKKNFDQLTGFDAAVQKLQSIEKKALQVQNDTKNHLFSQFDIQKQSLTRSLQGQMLPLKNLAGLGQQKKQKILQHYAEQSKQVVAQSNKDLEEGILKKFNFEDIYQKGLGAIGSKNQLSGIVQGFKDTLTSVTAKKSLLGCF